MKQGMTLVEVLLAFALLAVGSLALMELYALGLREGREATDEFNATAVAVDVMSRAVSQLADTNLAWSVWQELAPLDNPQAAQVPAEWRQDVPSEMECEVRLVRETPTLVAVSVEVLQGSAGRVEGQPFFTEVRFQGRFDR